MSRHVSELPPTDTDEWYYDEVVAGDRLDPIAYVRTACKHARLEPVTAGRGDEEERVAWLCLSCDAQLPADWRA